jgi:hypothetical protein
MLGSTFEQLCEVARDHSVVMLVAAHGHAYALVISNSTQETPHCLPLEITSDVLVSMRDRAGKTGLRNSQYTSDLEDATRLELYKSSKGAKDNADPFAVFRTFGLLSSSPCSTISSCRCALLLVRIDRLVSLTLSQRLAARDHAYTGVRPATLHPFHYMQQGCMRDLTTVGRAARISSSRRTPRRCPHSFEHRLRHRKWLLRLSAFSLSPKTAVDRRPSRDCGASTRSWRASKTPYGRARSTPPSRSSRALPRLSV